MIAPFIALVRSPRMGVDLALRHGSAVLAFVLMAVASVASTVAAAHVAAATDLNELFFAGTRQPWVQAMIDQLGPERTAVLLYLVQRSYDAVIIATAISPLFVWLLGSSAIHASARLAGIRRPYAPLLVLFAYATALTLVPASIATLALGGGETLGSRLSGLIGWACIGWLGFIAYRAIQSHYGVSGDKAARILVIALLLLSHYGVSGDKAARILVIALLLFYFVPLVLIIAAASSILIAAVLLEYF